MVEVLLTNYCGSLLSLSRTCIISVAKYPHVENVSVSTRFALYGFRLKDVTTKNSKLTSDDYLLLFLGMHLIITVVPVNMFLV